MLGCRARHRDDGCVLEDHYLVDQNAYELLRLRRLQEAAARDGGEREVRLPRCAVVHASGSSHGVLVFLVADEIALSTRSRVIGRFIARAATARRARMENEQLWVWTRPPLKVPWVRHAPVRCTTPPEHREFERARLEPETHEIALNT
jgi:hypothetical protein